MTEVENDNVASTSQDGETLLFSINTEPKPEASLNASAISSSSSFIRPCGIKFCLDGKPWYSVGTNAWNIHRLAGNNIAASKARIKSEIAMHASKGANTLRIFSHSDGSGGYAVTPIQPSPGVFNEQALSVLDYTLAVASDHNIHVILTLANFEPFTGGMQWYVDRLVCQGCDKELFYTNFKAKYAYKKWVSTLANRKNTVNGRIYKADPTVMAFELLNEPHTRDGYEKSRGLPPGKLAKDWIGEMAKYLKETVKVEQMVASGEEGYRSDGPTTGAKGNNWINGGLKGVDFVGNVRDTAIDFATVHCYPDNWGFSASEYKEYAYFMRDRSTIAHSNNKPIIMEEYGQRVGYLPSRNTLLTFLQDTANSAGYAGTLVWEASAETGIAHYAGYVFSYGEDGTEALLRQYKALGSGEITPSPSPPPSTGDCQDIPPSATYTCAQQAGWGKCKESWMQGFCKKSCNTCS